MSSCARFPRLRPGYSLARSLHRAPSVFPYALQFPHRRLHKTQLQFTRSHSNHPEESGKEKTAYASAPPISSEENLGCKRFADFDLAGKVYVVTGGARGLGLSMAEALVEAGGKVYCLDRAAKPEQDWGRALARVVPEWGGSLNYVQVDVEDTIRLDHCMKRVAEENQRLDGVVAAAGIQQIKPAVEYFGRDATHLMNINYTGVLMTATSAARQMLKYKCHGSIVLVASMSGLVANKGLPSCVYNSSKAAIIQLTRNLAMEWSPVQKDGSGGIRVNCISPGHVLTPMVKANFEEIPGLREMWEKENMMGRLAETTEFKGAVLYLISTASSFMTGSNLIVDGGHTSW